MFAVLKSPGKAVRRAVVALAALALAACEPVAMGNGPALEPGGTVQVALLVPSGSGQASDDLIARSLEQSARLAMADLNGAKIDLRVYSTGGQAGAAAAAATRAVDEGAKIILGPVYAEEANAAGVAVASRGVSVLSFSNNTAIAGGNVFVLGPTFQNSAERLARYAARSGKRNIFIAYGNSPGEIAGRDAIAAAVSRSGARVAGTGVFELSQQGVVNAVPQITAQVRASGADALFLTPGTDGALPLVTQLLRDNGLGGETQFIGLTRWDIPPAAAALPGLQGGWFAMPDPGLTAQFQSRYSAAYGESPHGIGSLAYDGIAAIGALAKSGRANALSGSALTQGSGFAGVNGVFRLRGDGTNERGLAIATIRNNQVVTLDPAPRSFGGAGF
ncbi:MAG: penicillin-binding protein activator [Paracoccaceae bacterium]